MYCNHWGHRHMGRRRCRVVYRQGTLGFNPLLWQMNEQDGYMRYLEFPISELAPWQIGEDQSHNGCSCG